VASFNSSGGTRINYRLTGSGPPPMVFIHGWCSNLRHWDAQARHFQRSHRVLRMDRPGFGRSGGADQPHTWRQQADIIAELMRSKRIRNAVVAGHAGGTGTALELAARHSDRVHAIVIIDGAPGPGMSVAEARAQPFAQQLAGDGYDETLETAYRSYFSELTAPDIVDDAVADAVRTPQHVAVREIEQIRSTNTISAAKRIRQPALWIVAENSGLTPERVREHVPQARFGRTVGSAHFVQIDVPDQVNAMIGRFVRGL
jgi:pimeloyl-ACP methyl ester carboxylesterase